MGLAASQARLLFLTSRMSDLELRAQVISNQKIRLAMQSSAASLEYTRELDQKKFQIKNGYSNGSPTYTTATVENVTAYNSLGSQKMIQDNSGRIIVSQKMADNYNAALNEGVFFFRGPGLSTGEGMRQQYRTLKDFLDGQLHCTSIEDYKARNPKASDSEIANMQKQITYLTNVYSGAEGFMRQMGYTSDPNNTNSKLSYDSGAAAYYSEMYNQMKNGGYKVINESDFKDADWLENGILGGGLRLYDQKTEADGKTKKWENVSWTSGDPDIQEVEDTAGVAKAEAKYETTVAQINAKDKILDLELKNVDTEHSAVQNEIDSVKKIIDKNIERAFKMFQA